MTRLNASNTSQSGIETAHSAANSRGDERIHEWPRALNTTASAKTMNPVHAMGVFHDANGSIPASVAASETIMIARPVRIPATADADDREGVAGLTSLSSGTNIHATAVCRR